MYLLLKWKFDRKFSTFTKSRLLLRDIRNYFCCFPLFFFLIFPFSLSFSAISNSRRREKTFTHFSFFTMFPQFFFNYLFICWNWSNKQIAVLWTVVLSVSCLILFFLEMKKTFSTIIFTREKWWKCSSVNNFFLFSEKWNAAERNSTFLLLSVK